MRTIALRFSENFSPDCGTIEAHCSIIQKNGYVWYGKMGSRISDKVRNDILSNKDSKILLIRSGHTERYIAKVVDIKDKPADLSMVPSYYRNDIDLFKTWFKVVDICAAPDDIMSKCIVISSNQQLGIVAKHSMSPFFVIEFPNE